MIRRRQIETNAVPQNPDMSDPQFRLVNGVATLPHPQIIKLQICQKAGFCNRPHLLLTLLFCALFVVGCNGVLSYLATIVFDRV